MIDAKLIAETAYDSELWVRMHMKCYAWYESRYTKYDRLSRVAFAILAAASFLIICLVNSLSADVNLIRIVELSTTATVALAGTLAAIQKFGERSKEYGILRRKFLSLSHEWSDLRSEALWGGNVDELNRIFNKLSRSNTMAYGSLNFNSKLMVKMYNEVMMEAGLHVRMGYAKENKNE